MSPPFPGAFAAVADRLAARGTDIVFGLPGDDLDLLAALDARGIRMVLCRDQRNAMFMATGYAMRSGRTGVCAVGKGPAVTNALTGLLEARSSGAAVLLLAGGTAAERLDAGAFQELDQLRLVRPLTRWAYRVEHPARLLPALDRALLVAGTAPTGPVYLEVPDHLLSEPVQAGPAVDAAVRPAGVSLPAGDAALAAIRTARRPVLLVGGGMRHRNDNRRLERLCDRLGAAAFCTASGRGVFDEDHPAFCGLAGLYSPAAAGPLWSDTDLVVVLGSRLEETATYEPGFAPYRVPLVQVDLDPAALVTDRPGPRVLADAAEVVDAWLARLSTVDTTGEWRGRVAAVRAEAHADAERVLKQQRDRPRVHVAELLAALDRLAPADRVLVQENGLQDMWSYFYPHWRCAGCAGVVAPSEQTSLGFGAAGAAGVAAADPGTVVVALVGDGAFAMAARELPVLADAGLPVLYLVLRNGGYGWLQHQLDQRPGPTGPATRFVDPTAPLDVPAHPRIVRSMVTRKDQLDPVLSAALADHRAGNVAVVEVPVALTDTHPAVAKLSGDFPGGGVA
jgi:acetolactate synthase I/II/III large subunit